MSKRKAHDTDSSEAPTRHGNSKRMRIQLERVDGVLSQGKTALFRALKTARGFERQKLGRRQKEAREKNDEATIARLESEVKTLKQLNLEQLGKWYLYRTLCKIKSIAEAENFPQYIRDKVAEASQQKHNTAYANVTSRLFTANPTKEALEETLKKVGRALGVEAAAPGRKRLRKADFEQQEDGERNTRKAGGLDGEGAVDKAQASNHGHESEDFEGLDVYLSTRSSENDSNSQVRLRESSFSPKPAATSMRQTQKDPDDKEEDDETIVSDTSDYETEKATRAIEAPRATATTFIPSLMGGYISGSDSQPDTDEEEAVRIKERKNRRGQQARRAMWERRYGQNANHIKESKKSRDAGWDARKGAQDTGPRKGKKWRGDPSGEESFSGKNGRQKTNVDETVPKNTGLKEGKEAGSKIHPSWEAAKRKKEEQQAQMSFTGKKVKFE